MGTEVLVSGEPVRSREGLEPGVTVVVQGMFGDVEMTVCEHDGGGLYARAGEHLMATLIFGGDDRQCWVSTGMANLRGLTKLDIGHES